MLHHFSAPEAVAVLRNIGRLARTGYVVADLRRNWLAIRAAVCLPTFGSPLFRQDAVQSCRAAFTVDELRAMARQAGLTDFQVHRHQGVFRMVLAGSTAPSGLKAACFCSSNGRAALQRGLADTQPALPIILEHHPHTVEIVFPAAPRYCPAQIR